MGDIIPADELIRHIDELIADIHDKEIAFEENAAVHALEDGLTTDDRAWNALGRPERFAGEHQVALAWLESSPTARLWSSNSKLE